MENNTKKIVIFNELKSPRIEQAIFILRDTGCPDESAELCADTDAVSEAERLIDAYLSSLNSPLCSEKKRHRLRTAANIFIFSACTLILAALFISILR